MRPPTFASAVLLLASLAQAVPVQADPFQADTVACFPGLHVDQDILGRYVDPPRPRCLSSPLDSSIAIGDVQGCVERNLVLRHACVDVHAPTPCVTPPLSAPPVLQSASREPGGVFLEWEAPATVPFTGTPAEYTIYRAVAFGAGWLEATTQPLATVAGVELSYLDGTARVGVHYAYWVTATPVDGCESPPSNPMLVAGSENFSVPPDVEDCIAIWSDDPVAAVQNASLDCLPFPVGP